MLTTGVETRRVLDREAVRRGPSRQAPGRASIVRDFTRPSRADAVRSQRWSLTCRCVTRSCSGRRRGVVALRQATRPSAARSPGARPWSPPSSSSLFMFWAYGVVPHQWLTWADNELELAPRHASSYGPAADLLRAESGGRSRSPSATQTLRDIVAVGIYGVVPRAARRPSGRIWQNRGQAASRRDRGHVRLRPSAGAEGSEADAMASTDANPPMPEFRDDYVLQEVDADCLAQGGQAQAVHPHRPVRVHHVRGLRRHLPVEVHPHGHADAIDEAIGTEQPGVDPERPRRSSSSTTTCAPAARCASTGARPA